MRVRDANPLWRLDEKIDPAWTALVIVDVQNDFAHPSGACAKTGDDVSQIPPVVERIARLLDKARQHRLLIIYLAMNNDMIYVDPSEAEVFARRGLGGGPCQSGSFGADFIDGVRPAPGPNEIVVTKHRASGIWGTPLDLLLKSNGIRTVVMAGIATEVCVESTARDLLFLDYRVVMAEDCMTGFSAERHQAALTLFKRSFGVVAPSSEIMAAWSTATTPARGWQSETKRKTVLATLAERTRPVHTALVVIGLQEMASAAKDAQAARQARALEAIRPTALALLDSARKAGVMIIHVRSDYGELVDSKGLAQGLGSEPLPSSSGDFLPDFAPLPDEPVIVKHRFNAFHGTELDLLMRSNAIRTIVPIGRPVECCIDTTARDAAMRDLCVVLPEDCLAGAVDAAARKALLKTLGQYFALVTPSLSLRSLWAGAPHREAERKAGAA